MNQEDTVAASSRGGGEDLVTLLREDHQAMKALVGQVGQAGVDQRDLFSRIVHDLITHEVAEEEVVYPAVRREVEGGDQLADARIAEQHEAEETLAKMEKMDPDTPQFASQLQALKEDVLKHAEAEETHVFPRLQFSGDAARLEHLGSAYRAAKLAAPTHPDPNARGRTIRPAPGVF